jgi:hypothetical protein
MNYLQTGVASPVMLNHPNYMWVVIIKSITLISYVPVSPSLLNWKEGGVSDLNLIHQSFFVELRIVYN